MNNEVVKYEIWCDSFEKHGWYEDGLTEDDVYDLYEMSLQNPHDVEQYDTEEEAREAWKFYEHHGSATRKTGSHGKYTEFVVYLLEEAHYDNDGEFGCSYNITVGTVPLEVTKE